MRYLLLIAVVGLMGVVNVGAVDHNFDGVRSSPTLNDFGLGESIMVGCFEKQPKDKQWKPTTGFHCVDRKLKPYIKNCLRDPRKGESK